MFYFSAIDLFYDDIDQKNNPYLQTILEELQKLGADKIYLIKDTMTPDLTIPLNATLDSYLKSVNQNTSFMEVIL